MMLNTSSGNSQMHNCAVLDSLFAGIFESGVYSVGDEGAVLFMVDLITKQRRVDYLDFHYHVLRKSLLPTNITREDYDGETLLDP